MYVLNFFEILAGCCGTKGSGSRSRFDLGMRFSFFLIETVSITGQKFSECLKMAATVYQRDNFGSFELR